MTHSLLLESYVRRKEIHFLTLNVPCISESCVEIKIKLNFYFHTSLWCLKRFYEGLCSTSKGFIKAFLVISRGICQAGDFFVSFLRNFFLLLSTKKHAKDANRGGVIFGHAILIIFFYNKKIRY